MEETHTWEKHFRYLSDYFAHSLNVTSERRPRAHAHRPNLLKFTQLCVFASSYGWAAVRAAHITLRSHESADAARGSSHLCDSKKRLSRRIRRSGSGTFHLFSHPLSPTPSAPQAHALALIVACGKNSACLPKTRPWHQQASCWVLITAIMYLGLHGQIVSNSRVFITKVTCTDMHNIFWSARMTAYCWSGVQSKAGLSWVPVGCWWVSAASQRLWWGRRGYRAWRRRQTEVAAFYLDPYDTKPLLLSLFLND